MQTEVNQYFLILVINISLIFFRLRCWNKFFVDEYGICKFDTAVKSTVIISCFMFDFLYFKINHYTNKIKICSR